jgi:hypothetical protein
VTWQNEESATSMTIGTPSTTLLLHTERQQFYPAAFVLRRLASSQDSGSSRKTPLLVKALKFQASSQEGELISPQRSIGKGISQTSRHDDRRERGGRLRKYRDTMFLLCTAPMLLRLTPQLQAVEGGSPKPCARYTSVEPHIFLRRYIRRTG